MSVKKLNKYFIDFDSWSIVAESEEEAVKKAFRYIKQGKVPNISGSDVEEAEVNGTEQDELYDYIELEVK